MSRARSRRSPLIRTILFGVGLLLIVTAPLVGLIPGPGGLVAFAGGLVLILQNSIWARHRFVRLKRRFPRFGHFADIALRRRTARLRGKRAREMETATAGTKIIGFPRGLR